MGKGQSPECRKGGLGEGDSSEGIKKNRSREIIIIFSFA